MPNLEYDVHRNHKKQMRKRVVRTLMAVAFLYFAFLLPDDLSQLIVRTAAAKATWWARAVAVGVGTPTLAWILSFLLFASDSAFKGSNATARWLRLRFPANAAVEKYACADTEASALWFMYFDTWARDGSPYQTLLANTYSATYSARAVFYLRRALLVFLVLGSISVVAGWLVFGKYAGAEGHPRAAVDALVLGTFAAGFVFLGMTNRLPKAEAPGTGCWARVEDILGRSRACFHQDILRHAATLDAAFERLEAVRRGAPADGEGQRLPNVPPDAKFGLDDVREPAPKVASR